MVNIEGLPEQLKDAGIAARKTIENLYLDPSGFDLWSDEDGIISRRKVDGNLTCVRGECIIPAPLIETFRFFIDSTKYDAFNPVVFTADVVHKYSSTAWARVVQFQRMFTIGSRYFVELCSWSVLPEDKVLIYSWSEKLDHLHAPLDDDQNVRGHIHYAGIILDAIDANSCRATYIAKVDLCGSLPTAVVNLSLRTGPAGLGNIRDYFRINIKSDKIKSSSVVTPLATVEDLKRVADEVVVAVPRTRKPKKQQLFPYVRQSLLWSLPFILFYFVMSESDYRLVVFLLALLPAEIDLLIWLGNKKGN